MTKITIDHMTQYVITKNEEIEKLRALCARAADALQDWAGTSGISKDGFGRAHRDLIAQLREAK